MFAAAAGDLEYGTVLGQHATQHIEDRLLVALGRRPRLFHAELAPTQLYTTPQQIFRQL